MLYQPMTTALLVETSAGEMRLFNDKVSADTWQSRQPNGVKFVRSVVVPRNRKRHVTIPAQGMPIRADHECYWLALGHLWRAVDDESRMSQGQ